MAKFRLSNLYVISALATIGGLIQGFDVSSMSAIIGTEKVHSFCFIGDVETDITIVQNVFQPPKFRSSRWHYS